MAEGERTARYGAHYRLQLSMSIIAEALIELVRPDRAQREQLVVS
jgi:hypothetical protein